MSAVVLNRKLLTQAQSHIIAADKTMAIIIAQCGAFKLHKKEPPFHTLAVSIINQQLSQKAAATIEKRLSDIIPSPFTCVDIARTPAQQLRLAGISSNKARYLHELAQRINEKIIRPETFKNKDNETVINELTACPGVGRWTAEMFLMFALHRADVVSVGDAALRRAARQLYGRRYKGDDAEVLLKIAQKWKPYRTVGCRYLWRSLRMNIKLS